MRCEGVSADFIPVIPNAGRKAPHGTVIRTGNGNEREKIYYSEVTVA
jgi:hypothetical protein